MLKYKLKKFNRRKTIIWSTIILLFVISGVSLINFYAAYSDAISSLNAPGSGVSADGTTVIVNDLQSDWNYYMGLNYTEIKSRTTLPSYSNTYNEDNLVALKIVYDGTDINHLNNANYRGFVSNANGEGQYKFEYYKYYPVKNGKIEVELIDNPFTARPTDLGFNGWACNQSGAGATAGICGGSTISYDDTYYTRYITLTATSAKTMTLYLNATWAKADVRGNNIGSFKDKSMQQVFPSQRHTVTLRYQKYETVNGYVFRDNYTFVYSTGGNNSLTTVRRGGVMNNSHNGTRILYHYRDSNVGAYTNYEIAPSGTVCDHNSCQYYSVSDDATASSYNGYSVFINNNITAINNNNYNTYVYYVGTDWINHTVTQSNWIHTDAITNFVATGYYYNVGSTTNTGGLYYANNGTVCSGNSCSGNNVGYKLIQYSDSYNNVSVSGYTAIDVSAYNTYTPQYDQWGNLIPPAQGATRNPTCTIEGTNGYSINNCQIDTNDTSFLNNYYYLVTRDINIYTGSAAATNKPFTVEGGSYTSDNVSNDLAIVNSTISNDITVGYHNFKIGRGVSSNNRRTITGSSGGTSGKMKVIIESGTYNDLNSKGSGNQSSTEAIFVYGSDYDRARNYNNKLLIYYSASASRSTGNATNSGLIPSSAMIIKSGTFGTSAGNNGNDSTGRDYYTKGIYVGSWQQSSHNTALRTVLVEGGIILNINGGPCVDVSDTQDYTGNAIGIYIKGGTVTSVFGGAGQTGTSGNRIISVTGGQVTNSVAGGSNGNVNAGGEMSGDTLVYIGGNATIGYKSTDTGIQTYGNWASNTFYALSTYKGSVFGAGLGQETSTADGVVNNSHVIINGGTIYGSVFGGGNFGTTGRSKNEATSSTIDLYSGTIEGSVYGAGNKAGAGYQAGNGRNGNYSNPGTNRMDHTVTINIGQYSNNTLSGNVNVLGSIYGGSNERGEVRGNVSINMYSGTVNTVGTDTVSGVYGGGYGSSTYVCGNTVLTSNTHSNDAALKVGEVYGGSSQGAVNRCGYNANKRGNTTITMNGGTVTSVFGGGRGNYTDNHKAVNIGQSTVTINSGIFDEVYGGHNIYGDMTTSEKAIINGGTIKNVFGGSKGQRATASTTRVEVNNGTITEGVYGGGKQATATTTNVTIKGGTFIQYDGNNNITGVPAGVFGGGYQAGVTGSSNVNIVAGANVYEVFGGSNESGLVANTNVNLTAGNVVCNAYGGGLKAESAITHVNITGSNFTYTLPEGEGVTETIFSNPCGSAYGGGKQANVTNNTNVVLNGTSKLVSVYGGSNESGSVATSNVTITRGDVEVVFGGNNQGGATNVTNVNFDKTGSAVQYVFGGSNGRNAGIGTSGGTNPATHTNIKSGKITYDVFGGGNEAGADGDTIVNVTGGEMRSVYGGGNKAYIGAATTTTDGIYISCQSYRDTYVNIVNGKINKNVYGSGNASFVCGDTHVNIGNAAMSEVGSPYNSYNNYDVNIAGSVFGGSETNAKETETLEFSTIGVDGDTYINITGNDYVSGNDLKLKIGVSVFGSGNNSIQTGSAYIDFNKIGRQNNPLIFASIQRATTVRITDSEIELTGARDRASTKIYYFGLIRINNLYMLGTRVNSGPLNGSTLYMRTGASFLGAYYSGVMNGNTFVPQTATKTSTGMTDGVSKNRIYMYANKILAVSNSQVPSYESGLTNAGYVKGMSYLGMYVRAGSNNDIVKGLYDIDTYNSNNVPYTSVNTDLESAYTYVYGKHELAPATQIETHGFYTDYVEDGKINIDYVGVTPESEDYYKWTIGVAPAMIDVDLQATKYSVEGAANATIDLQELKEKLADGTLTNTEWHDAKMTINKVTTSQFGAYGNDVHQGQQFSAYLVDKTAIPPVNNNDINNDGVVDANNYFALSMGTTSAGWLDNYKTNFYSDPTGLNSFCDENGSGGCTGHQFYLYDSTTVKRSLTFWLYYSKNLDFSYSVEEERAEKIISLGTITIDTEFYNPHGSPDDPLVPVTINISVTMNDGDKDGYGNAISPGKKYEVFQSKATSVVANGAFSIYQSLSLDLKQPMASNPRETWSVDKIYGTEDTEHHLSETYRYLVSDYHLPVGATITMLDLKTGEQYYYKVNNTNYNGLPTNNNGDYIYKLENFIRMGSTSTTTNLYDDDMLGEDSLKYYSYTTNSQTGEKDKEFAIEEFIFTVDLSGVADAQQVSTTETHYLYMEINRDEYGVMLPSAIVGPVGDPTTEMQYSLVPNIKSTLSTTGGFVQNDGTVGDSTTIYVGEQTELQLDTSLVHKSGNTVVTTVDNTNFDDYKLGAKITIWQAKKDGEGQYIYEGGELVYEQLTTDLFGTVISINGVDYYPQTDGSTRLRLAGRITDVVSMINIDFSNSDLEYGDYKLVVETFASYDGFYYGDFGTTTNSYLFTLLNNEYGIDVTLPPAQVTRDVNTGKDKNGNLTAQFDILTKNGLASPNIKVMLQRRVYDDNYYNKAYVNVPLSNIASEMHFNGGTSNVLNSCFAYDGGECIIYNLGSISNSRLETPSTATLVFKDKTAIGTEVSNPATSSWKSGTYRLQFIMYDGNTEVGRVYEYIIIRSLDVDENIEGS